MDIILIPKKIHDCQFGEISLLNNVYISIIIPIYNMQLYLDECLSSLVKQDWKNSVEIICVDDGSTDNSLDICKKYVKKFSYIKVIHKINGGVSSARNLGLKNAQGKYIAWVDPDDYVTDDFWNNIKMYLDKDYDVIFFDHYKLFDFGIKRIQYSTYSQELRQNDFIRELHDDVKIASYLPTKISKRFLWDNVTFPENISYGEDSAALPQMIIHAKKIFYINKPLYFYRQHDFSICHNASLEAIETAYDLVKKRYQFFTSKGFQVSEFGVAYKAYTSFLYMLTCDKNTKKSNLYKILYKDFYCIVKKNKYTLWKNSHFSYKNKFRLALILSNMKIFYLYKFIKSLKFRLKR